MLSECCVINLDQSTISKFRISIHLTGSLESLQEDDLRAYFQFCPIFIKMNESIACQLVLHI